MAITEAFRRAVQEGDVRGIRIMMKDSLLVDPTFNDFNAREDLSKDVPGLYDVHDNREMKMDSSLWNDDYMNKLMVQVVGNFSHERINHLKNVVRYLRPIASSEQRSETRNDSSQASLIAPKQSHRLSYQEQKRQDELDGRIVKIAGGAAGGAIVGGVVGGAVAGFATASILVGAAVGAVVIGSVVAITTNGE